MLRVAEIAILLFALTLIQLDTSISSEIADSCNLDRWNSFKLKYGKKYGSNSIEDKQRRAIFCKNLNEIGEHNANPRNSYKMGMNEFSDKSKDEIMSMMRSDAKSSMQFNSLNSYEISQIIDLNEDSPSHVDWSENPKRVSATRFQGACGSCWAFATISMLEGQEKPNDNETLIELSEQQLIDCDYLDYGCAGGYISTALQEIRRLGGVMSENDYPYVSGLTGYKQKCSFDLEKTHISTRNLGKVEWLMPGNETLLKQVVASYEPVAIGMHANYEFNRYESGIFYSDSCDKNENHAIVIVGYGTMRGVNYWKVKNSYAADWGQQGFGLMSRDRNNNCRVASHAYIINMKT